MSEAMTWRPIESAPQEEQPILLAFDRGRYGDIRRAPVIAFWRDEENSYGWHHWSHRDPVKDTPTHWMELPAPPDAARSTEEGE